MDPFCPLVIATMFNNNGALLNNKQKNVTCKQGLMVYLRSRTGIPIPILIQILQIK